MSVEELDDVAAEAVELGLPYRDGQVRRIEVPAGDQSLSALWWGSGPARVVLLHGAALNAHTWDGTALAWGADAVALDLPGHGDSPWRADGDYAPAVLAAQLRPALAALRAAGRLVERPVLVGQSLGGLTALGLLDAGEPAAHVVLVDIVPLPPAAAAQVADFLAGPTSFSSRQEVVDRALAFGFGGSPTRLVRAVRLNTRIDPDGSVRWKHHLGQLAAAGELTLGAGTEPLWQVLARTDVPVDLVRGERGLVVGLLLDQLTQVRPTARVVTLDTGHNVQEDAPRPLAQVLARLLDGGR